MQLLSRNRDGVSPSVMADELRKTNQQISKWCAELVNEGVLTLRRVKGGRTKRCTLTAKGLRVTRALQELMDPLEQPRELTETDPLLWQDLKQKLSSKKEYVVKAACNELKTVCRTTRVWTLGTDLWRYLDKQLSADSMRGTMLDCLTNLTTNAVSIGEEQVVDTVKQRYANRLVGMMRSEPYKNEWSLALTALKGMLSEEELVEFVKQKYGEAFELNRDQYMSINTLLLDSLRDLLPTHVNEIREWLYQKMEEEALVAEKAYSLFINLF